MNSLSMDGLDGLDTSLINSPTQVANETKQAVLRPKSLIEKARMNVAWVSQSSFVHPSKRLVVKSKNL